MVDNFKQIRNLLTFPTEHSFYFLEIIKRRKENPELLSHAKLIKDYYIYSLEEFDKLEGGIKEKCDVNNARAYFRLNVRDSKKIAHQFNKRLAELLITEDYKNISRAYASVVGEFHADPDKKWLIDVDAPEGSLLTVEATKVLSQELIARITEIYSQNQKGESFKNPIVAELQTKNGIHLITRPFRLDVFRGEFPTIDVHKDNPTILYQP